MRDRFLLTIIQLHMIMNFLDLLFIFLQSFCWLFGCLIVVVFTHKKNIISMNQPFTKITLLKNYTLFFLIFLLL